MVKKDLIFREFNRIEENRKINFLRSTKRKKLPQVTHHTHTPRLHCRYYNQVPILYYNNIT